MRKKFRFISEFKAFISRGNVIDMAVGVIVGGAFSKIVTSLVNDIVMPFIGILLGGVDFSTLSTSPIPSIIAGGEPVSIAYGLFIKSVVDFLIIALVVFITIKIIEKLRRKKELPPAAPPAPSNEEVLLTEIRDLLRSRNE